MFRHWNPSHIHSIDTELYSSKLYQEGNYSCVASSKYGIDVKHFVIEGGEKIRYFETIAMQMVAQKG